MRATIAATLVLSAASLGCEGLLGGPYAPAIGDDASTATGGDAGGTWSDSSSVWDSVADSTTASTADSAGVDSSVDVGCTPPTGTPCSTFPQCGCKAGQNCIVVAKGGATGCVTKGPKGENDSCIESAECDFGLSCDDGLCRPYCARDADCKGGGTCRPEYYGGAIDGASVCITLGCDLLSPAIVCGPGKGCTISSTGTTTACTAAGAGGRGTACPATNPWVCAPGYLCTSLGTCAQWCRAPTDCTVGTCTAFTPPITYGGVSYGACQ